MLNMWIVHITMKTYSTVMTFNFQKKCNFTAHMICAQYPKKSYVPTQRTCANWRLAQKLFASPFWFLKALGHCLLLLLGKEQHEHLLNVSFCVSQKKGSHNMSVNKWRFIFRWTMPLKTNFYCSCFSICMHINAFSCGMDI